MSYQRDETPAGGLAIFGYGDPGGGMRARVVPVNDLERHTEKGLPWTPGNMSLNIFGAIPADSPYGATGDARLRPDLNSKVSLGPDTDDVLVMCDATQLDGSAWMHCPRTILKDALSRLEEKTGLRVVASFEHEFSITNWDGADQNPISYESIREVSEEVAQTLSRLEHAGLEPEIWFPEFGKNQHECTIAPSVGVEAADRAVIYREVVRESMRSFGREITFSPVLTPDGVGNGVHIHLSLIDADGNPVMYDPNAEGSISSVGHKFASGIVKHMAAVTALTAPSVISGFRMQPGRWSASHTVLSVQNRAAALRICPITGKTDEQRARGFNIEFRATDATASPYLALAALVYAGLEGIAGDYEPVPLFEGDITDFDEAALAEQGIDVLPQTLDESLAALKADEVAAGWFDEGFLTNYNVVKRSESEAFASYTDQGKCDFYAQAL